MADPKTKPRRNADTAPVRRVCILTGGGDAPGLNAVLRAFVKTGIELGLEVYGAEDGFEGLIEAGRLKRLSGADVRGILPRGGSILGCSNRSDPFAYPTRDEHGKKTLKDMSGVVLRRLKDNAIDLLVAVGGDGTMQHGCRLMEMGVRVVGIPKTIDNDLCSTDVTFGFDTAVSTATWAIDALHSTAESHDRVMIVEVMGRQAGWIALYAGIAGGADVVLIPEIDYSIERVADKIASRSAHGERFSLVVVGEGARASGGAASMVTDGTSVSPPRLGGAGQRVADELRGRVPHEIRVTVLGHLQRGGSPVAFDRLLGTRFGVKAARLCKEGRAGRMVALRGQDIVSVPIEEAFGQQKLVPPDGELAGTARAIGIELGAA